MKLLARWSATLTLIGSTIFGSVFSGNLEALALSQEEIVQKLGIIPVFIIADDEGRMVPLSLSNPEQEQEQEDKQPFFAVFISQADAVSALENLESSSPDLEDTLQAVPVPLGEAYQLIKSNQEEEDAPPFVFVPEQEQLQSAVTILEEQEQEVQINPLYVPLFFFANKEDGAYVTISRGENNNEKILLFFDGQEAQQFLDNIQQQEAESQDDVEIKVAFLHQWIRIFESSDDEALGMVELVPLPESQEFLREFLDNVRQQEQNQPQPSSGE